MSRRTNVDPRFPARLRELRTARGLGYRALARRVPCTHPHVINMEAGRHDPSPEMAARLDDVLDAGGALKALVTEQPVLDQSAPARTIPTHEDRIADSEAEVDPSLLSRLTGAAWFGMLAPDVAELSHFGRSPATAPTRLEYPHVEALRSSTSAFEQWDHHYGGGMVRAAMGGQFEWACRAARNSSMTGDLRRAWQSATARLGDLVGWASFDAGEHRAGQRYFLAALQLAGEADDLQQRTHTATSMSRQLSYLGATDAALDTIGLARIAWRGLPPLGRSVIGIVEARAYGRIGDRRECQRAVGLCDEYFTAGAGGALDDPTWSYYADEGQVLGDAGHALFDLAMITDDRSQAVATIERLEAAYARHPPEASRSRALTMVRIAILKARFGDPEEACSATEIGIADAAQVSSRRVADDLRALDTSLGNMATPSKIVDSASHVRTALRQLADANP